MKTEKEWKEIFYMLQDGDCSKKKDWFFAVGNGPNTEEIKDIKRLNEHFVAFGKFAKSYSSSRKVEDAFNFWVESTSL